MWFPGCWREGAAVALWVTAAAGAADDARSGPRLSWLENGEVRVAVDLRRGGSLVHLERGGSGNVINNHDLGRQVQLSFYSGPVPFSEGGQSPARHWEHLGWNPVQTGDDFRNGSEVLAHENDGRLLHVRCRPLQWPLNRVPADCVFDSWLELDGAVVKGRARLTNARRDRTVYGARQQELPAVYANAAFPRVVSYTGDAPFSGGAVAAIPKAQGSHPWTFWHGTEGWSALLGSDDRGLGLITPGRIQFTGGFAGTPGPNDPEGNSTGYMAGLGDEILDHDIVYEYRYELLFGTLTEIRARAGKVRAGGLPAWRFASDRQGWHWRQATDGGWPVHGAVELKLGENDPQMVSSAVFWKAEEAPVLVIEGRFTDAGEQGTVHWQRHGAATWGAEDFLTFPIRPEATRHVVRLADAASYRGGMVRLRIDPGPGGRRDGRARIESVRLTDRAD